MKKYLSPSTSSSSSSGSGELSNRQPSRLASSPRQFLILAWKNSLLLGRNLVGAFFELVLSVFIVSMLLVTRHFIENVRYSQQQMPAYNVIDFFFNNLDEDLVLVYPSDSAAALNVVRRAFWFITSEKWWYKVNSMRLHIFLIVDYIHFIPL